MACNDSVECLRSVRVDARLEDALNTTAAVRVARDAANRSVNFIDNRIEGFDEYLAQLLVALVASFLGVISEDSYGLRQRESVDERLHDGLFEACDVPFG